MQVTALPSLIAGSLFLTFLSEKGATVRLVVAFPAQGEGVGSPLITVPFRVDPSRPMRFEVTEGLSKMLNTTGSGKRVEQVDIRLALENLETQSGRYNVTWENGAFTKFEGM
jgi:hypothetical protein